MSNCGYPDGVIHPHSERCHEAGLREGRAELDALRAGVEELARDFQGTTYGTLARRLLEQRS